MITNVSDVLFGIAEVERVNDHANIRRVLAGLANMGDLDELESSFVHGRLELLVAIPIAIRLLDDNAALEEKFLQHRLYVEACILGVPRSQRDVLEITEQREIAITVHGQTPFSSVVRVLVGSTQRHQAELGDRPAQ